MYGDPGQRSRYSDQPKGWNSMESWFDCRQRKDIYFFSMALRPLVRRTASYVKYKYLGA